MTVGHPTRCVARSTVISACLLAALSLPIAADAQPAEHAGVRGQERAHQVDRADRGDAARRDTTRPGRAKAHDRVRRTDTSRSSRTTASATTLASASSGSPSDATAGGGTDRTGPPAHANGRAQGHQDRGSARTLRSATGDAAGGGASADRAGGPNRRPRPAAAGSPAGRDVVERDTQRPAPAPAAQGTRRPASTPATATIPPATNASAPAPAPADAARDRVTTIVPLADGRRVVTLDLVGPFAELLDDVVHSIERVAPRALGPAAEPLARVVPLLLAMLGAFLALQRGIGRGLGHVPMVVTTEPQRNVDVRV